MFCQTDTLGIDCRNGSVSFQSHSQCLCQAVHAVCSVHTGAGTTGRTGLTFKFFQFFFGNFSCCIGTYCLKHAGKAGFVALYVACHHGTAADKYGGNVDTGCCHQKSRYVLIAVGYHYQGIKLMCHGHGFCGICNQVSGYQGIFHADVSHGNAVTDSNGREHYRGAACHGNTLFYGVYNLVQVHVARYDFVVGADNTD